MSTVFPATLEKMFATTDKLTSDKYKYLTEHIYRKLDDILLSMFNQISPRHIYFRVYTLADDELNELFVYVNQSWAIHIDLEDHSVHIPSNALFDDYCFYPVYLHASSNSDSSAPDQGHMMLIIREVSDDSEGIYYFFDPNGEYYDHPELMNLLTKTFEKKGKRLHVSHHQYYNSSANCKLNQFDKGLCGVWCIFMMQALQLSTLSYQEILTYLDLIDYKERNDLIYRYSAALYLLLKGKRAS